MSNCSLQGAVDGSSTNNKELTRQLQTDISVLTSQNKELREMIVHVKGRERWERNCERVTKETTSGMCTMESLYY